MKVSKNQLSRILNKYYLKEIVPELDDKMIDLLKKYTHAYEYDEYSYSLYKEIERKHPERKEAIEELLPILITNAPKKELTKEELDYFNDIIKKGKLPFPMTVYRGTTKQLFDLTTEKSGDIITPLTWCSTTLSYNYAKWFSGNGDDGLIIEYDLPKYYPAFYTSFISYFSNEKEFILTRNTPFQIVEKSKGRRLSKIKVVPLIGDK